MTQPFRLSHGGRIDRALPLRFTFDGREFTGYAGDTLASALLANGVRVIGRSFKYHRPRGLLAAGAEEPNGLVQVGVAGRSTPNVRATELRLVDGVVARSQNTWPSARFDVASVLDHVHGLLPPGFYYKTFTWPSWAWYEHWIRRSAGLGRAAVEPDPDRYAQRHLHCDVIIIGAGPAGIAAALSCVAAGADTVLVDDHDALGGSLLWDPEPIAGDTAAAWLLESERTLIASRKCRLLLNTCVTGAYEDLGFTAVETVAAAGPRERLWKIRARAAVLATGAIERPMVFPDNDKPGIMLASAVREYIGRYAVRPGHRAAVFANNDSAYRALPLLAAAGVEVVGVVDSRVRVGSRALQLLGEIPLWSGQVVSQARGGGGLRGIHVAPHANGRVTERETRTIGCDVLLVSGGWSPSVHLAAQAGATLEYQVATASFVARTPPRRWQIAGSAAGACSLSQCLKQGATTGMAAAVDCDLRAAVPPVASPDEPFDGSESVQPLWMVEFDDPRRSRRQWLDFQYDVTVTDVRIAAAEGYDHVELMKRYTSAGMAPDQGKTGQLNAQGALAQIMGRPLEGARVTTLRPPYRPMTLGVIAGIETGDLYRPFRLLPAHEAHVRQGARFDEYGGWQRPACYPGPGESEAQAIQREVCAARSAVAVLDASPLGKLEVVGRDAATLLDRACLNNILSLPVGCIRYVVMLNERGVVFDDGVVARLDSHHYLVNSTSARAESTRRWLERLRQVDWPDLDVTLLPVTEQWATFAVSGPQARSLLEALEVGIALDSTSFPHMAVRQGRFAEVPTRFCRVSFTGEASYEISVPASAATRVFECLVSGRAGLCARPIGLESLATLRIEKGYLHVGTDTDGATTPEDIGLRSIIDRKPRDFIGRRSLALAENRRTDRRNLVGLVGADPGVRLPAGAHVIEEGGDPRSIGTVTSSCLSPTLGSSIAMALISGGRERIGQVVTVWSEGQMWRATVAGLPFVDPQGERLHG